MDVTAITAELFRKVFWVISCMEQASKSTFLPNTVKYSAIREDANVNVGNNDIVKMSLAFVGEKEIGHPNFVRIRQRQIFNFAYKKQIFKKAYQFNESSDGIQEHIILTVVIVILQPLVEPFFAEGQDG